MSKWERNDDNAAHQIRLFWSKKTKGSSVGIAVGCTCRRGRFGMGYEPIVVLTDEGDSPWPYFNDPANHNTEGHPFTKEHQRGPITERPAAPEAPLQREVADEVLDQLGTPPVEARLRPGLQGGLLPV